jgi:hypothetical protein
VLQHHPEYLLRDDSGRVITRSDGGAGPDEDQMTDPGNPQYQQQSAAHLVDLLQTEHWDGVYLDEINQTWAWNMARDPANYTTEAQWQTAALAYVRTVCEAVHAAGKTCYANTGADSGNADFWNQTVAATDGANQEFFVAMDPNIGGAPARATIDNGWWLMQVDRLRDCEKQCQVRAYAADVSAARYALASFLAVWQGDGVFSASTLYDGAHDVWTADFENARRLGSATGAAVDAGDGILLRRFDHGYVLVNPHDRPASTTIDGQSVSLGAADARIVV